MRKYIHIARCMKPKLTEEASAVIAEEYSRLRSEDVVESDVARVKYSQTSGNNGEYFYEQDANLEHPI